MNFLLWISTIYPLTYLLTHLLTYLLTGQALIVIVNFPVIVGLRGLDEEKAEENFLIRAQFHKVTIYAYNRKPSGPSAAPVPFYT